MSVAREESRVVDNERGPRWDGDVLELVLLLPGHQVRALEDAAWRRGLTGGQLARRLIRGFLEEDQQPVGPIN